MQEGYLMQFWSRHVWESAARQLFPCFIRPNLLKPIVLKGLSVEMSCWNSWRVEFARHSCSTMIKSMWLVKSYLWYIWYQKLIWGTFGEFWQFYVHIPSWFAILQWKRGLWLNSFGLCWNLCEVLISLSLMSCTRSLVYEPDSAIHKVKPFGLIFRLAEFFP